MISKALLAAAAATIAVAGATVAVVGPQAHSDTDASAVFTTDCSTLDQPSTYYVMVTECAPNLTSVSATYQMPQPAPAVDGNCGNHSNGQITLMSGDDKQINAIEVGVVTYPDHPGLQYLQIGRHVGAQKDAKDSYPSADWHPYPNAALPNLPQPAGTQWSNRGISGNAEGIAKTLVLVPEGWADVSGAKQLDLSIRYSGGEWQVWLGDKELGYYPDAIWPNGFKPTRAQWWGEVGANNPAPASCGGSDFPNGNPGCTTMGSGSLGDGAAAFSNMRTDPDYPNAVRELHQTDPKVYRSDRPYAATATDTLLLGENSFRYGGKPACSAPMAPNGASGNGQANTAAPGVPAPVVGGGGPSPDARSQPTRPVAEGRDPNPDSRSQPAQPAEGGHSSPAPPEPGGNKATPNDESCPTGMVRIAPPTELTSGCAPAASQEGQPGQRGQSEERPGQQGQGQPAQSQRQGSAPGSGNPRAGGPGPGNGNSGSQEQAAQQQAAEQQAQQRAAEQKAQQLARQRAAEQAAQQQAAQQQAAQQQAAQQQAAQQQAAQQRAEQQPRSRRRSSWPGSGLPSSRRHSSWLPSRPHSSRQHSSRRSSEPRSRRRSSWPSRGPRSRGRSSRPPSRQAQQQAAQQQAAQQQAAQQQAAQQQAAQQQRAQQQAAQQKAQQRAAQARQPAAQQAAQQQASQRQAQRQAAQQKARQETQQVSGVTGSGLAGKGPCAPGLIWDRRSGSCIAQ